MPHISLYSEVIKYTNCLPGECEGNEGKAKFQPERNRMPLKYPDKMSLSKTSKPCLTEKLSQRRCNPCFGQSKKEREMMLGLTGL